MPYTYDENGRRVASPTKGARREQAILNGAESQLGEMGADDMTVETIANAAGISRAGMYFYFRSKNDVLAALVSRYAVELTAGISTSEAAASEPAAALSLAVSRTADLWSRHGTVLRAAVELSAAVASIQVIWEAARSETQEVMVKLLDSAELIDREAQTDLRAIVKSLVIMTEMSFYAATRDDQPIANVARVVTLIWFRTLGLAPPSEWVSAR